MKEHKILTYSFKELSDTAKEKALEKFYDINIHDSWYEFTIDDFQEKLKEHGLACKHVYFDLDRAWYADLHKLEVIDTKLLYNHLDLTHQEKRVLPVLDLAITEQHGFCHSTQQFYNYLARTNCKRVNAAFDSIVDKANALLDTLRHDLLINLRKEYEYLTSREAVIETIECNDYEFTEAGKLFY